MKNTLSILIVSLTLAITSFQLSLNSKEEVRKIKYTLGQELNSDPIYLPETKYIKLITFGFNNFFSDIFWFLTVNYFGKELKGEKQFTWFSHMCNLVTELDNSKKEIFEFCGTLMSWIAKKPEDAERMFSKALEAHPDYWRFWYLRGFNYWYFLEDNQKASQDLKHAAEIPNSPVFLASLASRLISTQADERTAILFLKDLIRREKNQVAKDALKAKLEEAIKKGLNFKGKTAKTGAMRNEFINDL